MMQNKEPIFFTLTRALIKKEPRYLKKWLSNTILLIRDFQCRQPFLIMIGMATWTFILPHPVWPKEIAPGLIATRILIKKRCPTNYTGMKEVIHWGTRFSGILAGR